jgi:hypothetical protein
MTMTVTVTPEHGIAPPEAKTHYSTAKENKYTPIGTKTRVDVPAQNQKNSLQTNSEK